MNLTDLQESKKSKLAIKVLRESFNYDMKLSKLDLRRTHGMLTKVRTLIKESKISSRVHSSHRDPAYLKLLMIEQALSGHLRDLRAQTRIVVENEEVQKSQVVLAAQDMIDSVQKMLEQVSKMNVEELNAVVGGMKSCSEFEETDVSQFNSSASEALTALQQALKTAKDSLEGSLGSITGEGGMMPDANQPSDMPDEMSGEMPDEETSDEELPELPELPEEPEEPEEISSNLGRERR